MPGVSFNAKLHDPRTASREELREQIHEITKYLVLVAKDFETKIGTLYEHEKLVHRLTMLSAEQRDAWNKPDMRKLKKLGAAASKVAARLNKEILAIIGNFEMMLHERDVAIKLLEIDDDSLSSLKKYDIEEYELERRDYIVFQGPAKEKLGIDIGKIKEEVDEESRLMSIHDKLVDMLNNLKPLVGRLAWLIEQEKAAIDLLPFKEGVLFDPFNMQKKEDFLERLIEQVKENLIQQKKSFYDPLNDLVMKEATPVNNLTKLYSNKTKGKVTKEDIKRIIGTLTEPDEIMMIASVIIANKHMYSGRELDVFEPNVYQYANWLMLNAKKAVKDIKLKATHDMILGIKNKMSYEADIRQVVKDKKKFCLIMIDIDHFKQFNDTYGHDVGDKVLIEVADILKNNMRRGKDDVYRIGGEEIAIILQEADLDGGYLTAERLRKSVETHKMLNYDGDEIRRITISVGIVAMEGDAYNSSAALGLDNNDIARSIMKQTDTLLYAAKHSGRNNTQKDFFKPLPTPTSK